MKSFPARCALQFILLYFIPYDMFKSISHALRDACLLFFHVQMKKALELYEQLRQRMGVVIVGPSGAGKSTLWRMLRAALGRMGSVVKQYTMNPKAMARQQLLGHIDMDTREWSDGVLTSSARQVVREPQGEEMLPDKQISLPFSISHSFPLCLSQR